MVGCTFTTCLTEEQYDLIKKREENSSKKKEANSLDDPQQPILNPSTSPASTSSSSTATPVAATASSQTATTQTTSNTNHLNRTNFNLRGHKSEIKLVRWNEVSLEKNTLIKLKFDTLKFKFKIYNFLAKI